MDYDKGYFYAINQEHFIKIPQIKTNLEGTPGVTKYLGGVNDINSGFCKYH